MPELPEVETMCRGIQLIVGRKVARVHRPPCAFRPISIKPRMSHIQRRFSGRAITAISRLGKRVLIHAEHEVLILQPKMTGLVALDQPPDPDHVRLQVDFAGSPRIQLKFWDRRGLGTVELLRESEIYDRIIQGKLGPDALAISCEDFVKRLALTQRPVKVALLDQKLLAGIGNLYASEMLHLARIHPAKACSSLSRPKKQLLYQAMQQILLAAIEYEGSTLADGTYRNAINGAGSYQSQHLVYDRAGLPCPSCKKTLVRRIVQAQRSTFYCPRCQRP